MNESLLVKRRRTKRLQADVNLRFAPVGAAEPRTRWALGVRAASGS